MHGSEQSFAASIQLEDCEKGQLDKRAVQPWLSASDHPRRHPAHEAAQNGHEKPVVHVI